MIECHVQGLHGGWENADAPILEGVCLDLAVQDRFALPIMGPSGHGKTTLLYYLAGLKWPFAGRISWRFDQKTFSWDFNGLSASEALALRRQYFGFVFQNATLSDFLTVEENLRYPLLQRGWHEASAHRHIAKDAERFFDKVGDPWEDVKDRYPIQLSAGQRQRAALMQALLPDPWVLFADEPTGNLDVETRAKVMSVLDGWLKSSRKEHPRLWIWVTHHQNDPQNIGLRHRVWVEKRAVYSEENDENNNWKRIQRFLRKESAA
uniref:Putative ABC transport system ATP-binding protein n=1 Tax=Candidatus Kentrum sp. MB TaxID=2138164 RepID=A0A450XV91_9GAMM|nr:MAG: putative ABC transport system ATP-binding protein [Candidatus Kentron sp. MB]VFK76025.1 MAG: putative ABC transport system ATP-binding protein [Candidatus Kentron sp. MB]